MRLIKALLSLAAMHAIYWLARGLLRLDRDADRIEFTLHREK